jgi:hypothetical protein
VGAGRSDGLFLAREAPALYLISASGDRPFMLPGPLSFLGPTQATFALANLGPSRDHSHSKLLVYRVSTRPAGALELGGTFMNHFGGEGAQSARIGDRGSYVAEISALLRAPILFH